MTNGDRLSGLVVVLPVLLVAGCYAVIMRRRGRSWWWCLPVGVALIGAGLLVPWLPLAFAGVAVIGVDVYGSHVDRGRPSPDRGAARHRHRRG